MRQTRRILVITPNDAPASVCEMGIREALSMHPGWTLRRQIDWPTDTATIRSLQKWAPHGVLTLLQSPPFRFPSGEPVVIGLRNFECPVMVGFDEGQVGGRAAETLIGLGYTNLRALWLPHAAAGCLWFTPRFEGFMRRCAELGITAEPLTPSDAMLHEAVPTLVNALASLPAKRQPVALFCGNDYFAGCALQAAARLGLRVPQDLALLGADDLPGHGAEQLGLSSVQIPHFLIGQESIRLMDSILSGKPAPRHAFMVPVSNVSLRASTPSISLDDPVAQKALAFIDAHVALPLSIDQVAKAADVSRRTLTDRFRQTLGASVKDTIDRRRVGHAVALLQAGAHSIPEAAATIGCDDLGNFSRLVTRVTGKSPKQHVPKG